jgi:serine/threonine protein kinase
MLLAFLEAEKFIFHGAKRGKCRLIIARVIITSAILIQRRLERVRMGRSCVSLIIRLDRGGTQRNRFRAMKKLKKQSLPKAAENGYLNEMEILKSLDHPNVIKLYEFYSDSDYYYIITGTTLGCQVRVLGWWGSLRLPF